MTNKLTGDNLFKAKEMYVPKHVIEHGLKDGIVYEENGSFYWEGIKLVSYKKL
jgi:hypothetical protein